jgi:hypothetical protein
MKFMEAQKRPESAFVSVSQRANALYKSVHGAVSSHDAILFLVVCLYPGPQLHAGATLSRAIPRPLSPAFGIPPPDAEPQVELFGVRMLQNLPERSREVPEVLLLEGRLRLVAEEVERGQKSALGQRPEEQALVVAGARGHVGREGAEQQEKE